MGLAFSHCTAEWSYREFNDFRRKVANQIGINLDWMAGYWHGVAPPLSWETVDDDIVPLLAHSDCEGFLTPRECARVAPRLRELVADWEDPPGLCLDKGNALLLAEGMERAAAKRQRLQFR